MSPLRKARLERGWSIYELADAVGISAASISRLERRVQSTSPATAAKLAALLGLTLAQVLLPESNEQNVAQNGEGVGADSKVMP
ncbi:MAG: helix-turn-helix transcriptional regulator [Gammaproteobacteria bacterium]|nr:helix-turn-helix transcriptional regulator [Gammaproteobacteria bacterium]